MGIESTVYYHVIQDEDEAGLLEQVKSQVCDNVALYAQKYDEEFSSYLPNFVKAIWELLVTTGQEVKYDLVSTIYSALFEILHEVDLKIAIPISQILLEADDI